MSKKNSSPRALIIGVTGQDGAYLAHFLLSKNYRILGTAEDVSEKMLWRLKELGILAQLKLRRLNLAVDRDICNAVLTNKPDEIYNLGGVSSITVSQEYPSLTADISGMGVVRILEAIRSSQKNIKFFQASTSEVLSLNPIRTNDKSGADGSPYRIAKSFAHHFVRYYREKYGLFAACGILYNHESPLRLPSFVSRKIARGVALIKSGSTSMLELGQLDSSRDWGYAPEFVRAMWMMLQEKTPGDYVVATGESHTVREFVEEAFKKIGCSGIRWEGKGVREVGRDVATGRVLVKVKPEYFRPEIEFQRGDISATSSKLGWRPITSFQKLVGIMIDTDLERLKKESG